MKNYAIMTVILINGLGFFWPQDTDPCAEKRSLYVQYYQAGMYEDSRNFWLQALDICGGPVNMDFKFFKNGRVIYGQLKDKLSPESPGYRELSDSICWIYEEGLKHEFDKEWPLDYAVFLLTGKYDSSSKIDSLFKGYENDMSFNHPNYIYYYFQHLILNHYNKTTDKDAARNNIIDKYFLLYQKCLIGEQTSDEFEPVKSFLDKYFLMIQTPERLSESMEQQYNQLGDNDTHRLIGVKHAIELMEKKECEKGETYTRYTEELMRLEPSASGYLGLGKIALSGGEYDKAYDAFEKAMELDQDDKDIYLYYMSLTLYDEGKYKRAFNTAKTVQGEYKAKATVICANCIAATAHDCGESTALRLANYWLANDYIRKAHDLGESVDLNKFLDKAPDLDVCFPDDIHANDRVFCDCWNEYTIARF